MRPANYPRPDSSIRASIWKVSSSPRKPASAASSNSSVSVDRGVHLRENKSGSIRSFGGKSVARLRQQDFAAQPVHRAGRLSGGRRHPAIVAGGAGGGRGGRAGFESDFRCNGPAELG